MTIRFIQRSINKERKFFTGHYENLNQLYRNYNIGALFPNSKRVQSTLRKQGWISLLCDENNVEFRIEVYYD